FFQAEDGIRDFHVTGVQTCALPILAPALGLVVCTVPVFLLNVAGLPVGSFGLPLGTALFVFAVVGLVLVRPKVSPAYLGFAAIRSEERRVGNDGRAAL